MQPRATSVAFAAKPVADGADDVPVIVTVLFENAVVPFVPSNAANRISKLSTDVWLRAHEVNTTFPPPLPICLRVLGMVKVVIAPVAVIKENTLPVVVVVPMRSIAPNEIVVNAAIVAGAKVPPTLVKTGNDKLVNAAIVAG